MFDPMAAYKKMNVDPDSQKKYAESWDRIFGKKEERKDKKNESGRKTK